ncbi:hypothetical protein FACS1894211_01260 [Clostridia bacterium]|nr:hypothetical protein FACS1894211_01260 [Clostridia bacterium]
MDQKKQENKKEASESPEEIRFGRGLASFKIMLKTNEPVSEKLNALLELNRQAGEILLGRLDEVVADLEKLKENFLNMPAENAVAGELIYFGYEEEVISSRKSLAVQEFLLTREIVLSESGVSERAAYAFQLAETKDKILDGAQAREILEAAEHIGDMLSKMSRLRLGSIDRMHAENAVGHELNKLLTLKIGDVVTLPPIERSATRKAAPLPIPKPEIRPEVKPEVRPEVKPEIKIGPASAPRSSSFGPQPPAKDDKPDIAKAFSRENDKPDREAERKNQKRDEDEIKRALEAMRGKRAEQEEEQQEELDTAPVRPKSADEPDDYVDELSQNVIAEKWAAQIEALYKRFIGLIDGGETEKRDGTVSGLFPTIERLDRQHARLERLVETVKASIASRKKK